MAKQFLWSVLYEISINFKQDGLQNRFQMSPTCFLRGGKKEIATNGFKMEIQILKLPINDQNGLKLPINGEGRECWL